jgi:putative salt-induced outer membrane protein
MKKVTLLTGTAAILAALSVPAFAQTEIATGANVAGISDVDEGIQDIEDDVTDQFDRSADADRFGPADRRQGLFGSMSLSYTGRTGNVENQDFALAGRVSYNQGVFAQSVGMSIEYGEDDDGNKDTEETNVIYDAQYYFNDRMYGFAIGRFTVDGLVDGWDNSDDTVRDPEEDEDLRLDGFLGVGPGYRVMNSEATTWRVQAGVGVRYTQTGTQHRLDDSDTDLGWIVSSRFYHRFNENMFLTNDTDYLTSDSASDVLYNELGLNFKMTESLATRLSLETEYQSDRDIRTDNTFGVAVVYGF